jgi:hypothetical protein
MRLLAHEARGNPPTPIMFDGPVSAARTFKWPNETVIALVMRVLSDPPKGFAWTGTSSSSERVAMGFEVVGVP